MKKDIQTELDSLLATRHQRITPSEDEKINVEKTQREFVEKFNKVKREVIRPAMVEIGERVKAKGIEYYIDENARTTTAGEHVSDSIAIEFKIGNGSCFGVGCNKYSYDLSFFYNPTSKYYVSQSRGPESSMKLIDMTPDLIQQKILSVLKEVLG